MDHYNGLPILNEYQYIIELTVGFERNLRSNIKQKKQIYKDR